MGALKSEIFPQSHITNNRKSRILTLSQFQESHHSLFLPSVELSIGKPFFHTVLLEIS